MSDAVIFCRPVALPACVPDRRHVMHGVNRMQISIAKQMGVGAAHGEQQASEAPTFSVQPAINPASGPQGTPFLLSNGSVAPNGAALSRTLTLNGVDVSSEIYLFRGQRWYLSTAPGDLSLQITASNALGQAQSVVANATVEEAAVDTTAPVLSLATASSTGTSTATAGVETDTAEGTLFWVVGQGAGVPSAAQVVAGQDAAGVAASASGAQPVSVSGPQVVAVTGLASQTGHTAHFVHRDLAGNLSGLATSLTFTTDAFNAPDVMSSPSVTSTGTDSLTVVRAATPQDGGSAIQSFDLRYSTDETIWIVQSGISASEDLSGLSSATQYFVQTRAINAVGAGAWSPSASAVTDLARPVNTAAPVVAGGGALGSVLSVTTGIWEGTGVVYTYQWLRNGTAISGATSASHTVTLADDAAALRGRVTASNAAGSTAQDSANAISVQDFSAPAFAGVPGITGNPVPGETLTAIAAQVGAVPTSTRAWQWMRDDAPIAGASGAAYVVQSADAGALLSVIQAETNAVGSNAVQSASVSVSAAGTIVAAELGVTAQENATQNGKLDIEFANAVADGYEVWTYFGGSGLPEADPFANTLTTANSTRLTQGVGYTSNGSWVGRIIGTVYLAQDEGVAGERRIVDRVTLTPVAVRPVLSDATGTANGSDTINAGVTATSDNGTLFWHVSTNAIPPNAASLKSGAGALRSGSQPVNRYGLQELVITGLPASTGCFVHCLHEDVSTRQSPIVTTAQITTAASATVPAAFGAADWTLTEAFSVGADRLNANLNTLPANGGATITSLQYRVDSGSGFGAAQTFAGTAAGTRQITVLGETEADVQIRAVNGVGNGAWSNSRTATPQFSGGETATSVTIDGRTFTFGGSYQIVRHIDGPVAVVSAAPVTITPPPNAGGTRSGTMLNPVHGGNGNPQAFDNRRHGWTPSRLVSGPTSVAPGSVMMSSVSRSDNPDTRSGVTNSYQMVYVTPTAPDSNSLAPAGVGWNGRSGITIETAPDWAAKVASIPARPIGANVRQPFGEIIAGLGFNIGHAMYDGANAVFGYEQAMPYHWGGPRVATPSDTFRSNGTNKNWGGFVIKRMNEALAALHDDAYSVAERQEILIRLASFGKQTYRTLRNTGVSIPPDGGHNQFQNIAMQLYLWATDQSAALDDLYDAFKGNYDQAFFAPSDYPGIFANGFGSPADLRDVFTYENYPWFAHRRQILAVSGNRITIPTYRTFSGGKARGDENKTKYTGLVMTDGVNSFNIDGDNPDINNDASSTSFNVTGHNFSAGDTIWMRPGWTVEVGEPLWGLRGINERANSIVLTRFTWYAKDPRWTAALLTMHAIGQMRPDYAPAVEFMKRANLAGDPSFYLDWEEQVNEGGNDEALWNAHGTAILAMPQANMPTSSAPNAITLTRISEPSVTDYQGLQDGTVIGRLPGETSRPVFFAGGQSGGTNGDIIQVQLLRQDDSVFLDWTDVGTVSGSGWSGTLPVAVASDGWLKTRLRAKGNFGVTAANDIRWGVGDKVWIQGQSQLTFWAGSSIFGEPYDAGIAGRASIVNRAEPLAMVQPSGGKTSDGIVGFVNQWYHARNDQTPLMIVLEAEPGTSILQLTDDGRSGRSWASVATKVARYGATATALIYQHITSDANLLNGADHINIAMGLGGVSIAGFSQDHAFPDVLDEGFAFVLSPATRHGYISVQGDASGQIDRANQLNFTVGPPTPDYFIEAGQSPHPENSQAGNRNLGRSMAEGAKRALGYANTINPHFTGSALRSADGTRIAIPVTLNSGGTLTAANPSALQGFSVSENGGASYSETGFTTSIEGNSVVLTRTTGSWSAASSLRIAHNEDYGNYGFQTTATNNAQEAIVMAGILYDGAPGEATGAGFPVSGVLSGGKWRYPDNNVIVGSVSSSSDVTAPVLSAATGGTPSSSGTSASVTTNEGGGTLFSLVTLQSAGAPNQSLILATGVGQPVTASGNQTSSITGQSPSTAYRISFVHRDAAGNASAVASANYTTQASTDVTPPSLSGLSVAPQGTSAALSWSTNEGNGAAYWLVDQNASRTAAQVRAAGNAIGVTSAGVQPPINAQGLVPQTAYRFHLMQDDAAGNASIVRSTAFTTSAVATPGTVTIRQFDYNEQGFGATAVTGTITRAAGDLVYLIGMGKGVTTLTARTTGNSTDNFTPVVTTTNDGATWTVLVWNGTGLDPNTRTVTVTSAVGPNNFAVQALVIRGSGTGNSAVQPGGGYGGGAPVNSATITASAGSLILHLFAHRNFFTMPFTAPANRPTTVYTDPLGSSVEEGIFSLNTGNAQLGGTLIAVKNVGAGTSQVATGTMPSFSQVAVLTWEVRAP